MTKKLKHHSPTPISATSQAQKSGIKARVGEGSSAEKAMVYPNGELWFQV